MQNKLSAIFHKIIEYIKLFIAINFISIFLKCNYTSSRVKYGKLNNGLSYNNALGLSINDKVCCNFNSKYSLMSLNFDLPYEFYDIKKGNLEYLDKTFFVKRNYLKFLKSLNSKWIRNDSGHLTIDIINSYILGLGKDIIQNFKRIDEKKILIMILKESISREIIYLPNHYIIAMISHSDYDLRHKIYRFGSMNYKNNFFDSPSKNEKLESKLGIQKMQDYCNRINDNNQNYILVHTRHYKDWQYGLIVRKEKFQCSSENKLRIIYNKNNRNVYPLSKHIKDIQTRDFTRCTCVTIKSSSGHPLKKKYKDHLSKKGQYGYHYSGSQFAIFNREIFIINKICCYPRNHLDWVMNTNIVSFNISYNLDPQIVEDKNTNALKNNISTTKVFLYKVVPLLIFLYLVARFFFYRSL